MQRMPDILEKICLVKEEEVEALDAGMRTAFEETAARQSPPRGFRNALLADDAVSLIAEVKKASPSAGVIRADFDAVGIARCYQKAGAACVSVLTDRQFFQGDPSYLSTIREEIDLPVLRKDFIIDPVQVTEARALGADACLLIVAALERARFVDLLEAVRDAGMDALVEVHCDGELDVALEEGAELVGINNRNLRTFQVDLATTEQLAERIPDGTALVSESGIQCRADVERLKGCGIDAILVGETLMRADEIEPAVAELVGV
jgi:indole-3-glycerol phosphate synthase